MPRIDKVYTRTGDDGTTALGSDTRVSKIHPRVEAYGTVDELNAIIGVVLTASPVAVIVEPLREIQNDLLHLGADLSIPEADKATSPGPRIEKRHVDRLEKLMHDLGEQLQPLRTFVLPGGSPAAAQLHLARTICRRAERDTLRLKETETIGEHVVPYLNRLSDALFVMARFENKASGHGDVLWDSLA